MYISNVCIHHFIAIWLSLLNKALLSMETLQHGINFVAQDAYSNELSSSRVFDENPTISILLMSSKLMFGTILCHVSGMSDMIVLSQFLNHNNVIYCIKGVFLQLSNASSLKCNKWIAYNDVYQVMVRETCK